MEARDQVTLDHAHRPWLSFSEVEQGALLVELSASLRRRLMQAEMDRQTADSYRRFAHAARNAGNALVMKNGLPFVPDPPFPWSKATFDEVNARVPEITDWASWMVVDREQPLPFRHSALDLSQAGRELEHELTRPRTR